MSIVAAAGLAIVGVVVAGAIFSAGHDLLYAVFMGWVVGLGPALTVVLAASLRSTHSASEADRSPSRSGLGPRTASQDAEQGPPEGP